MVRGLYTAATGALVAQSNIDVIANNLANVNTSGFKRTLLQVESSESQAVNRIQTDPGSASAQLQPGGSLTNTPVGALGSGSRVFDTPAIFEQGPLQTTGNALDVGLQGPGFFTIQTPQGVRYTRDGGFVRDAQGRLASPNGDLVLGTNGAITLPNGPVTIDRTGAITSNGVLVDRLRFTQFTNPVALRPEGANRFLDAGAGARNANGTTVAVQGAQEKSNADVIRSMVDLITNQRWFDANEKMIQTQDDATGQAITTLGRSN